MKVVSSLLGVVGSLAGKTIEEMKAFHLKSFAHQSKSCHRTINTAAHADKNIALFPSLMAVNNDFLRMFH